MTDLQDPSGKQRGISTASWIVGLISLVAIYVLSPGPLGWALEKKYLPAALEMPLGTFFWPLAWCYNHIPWVHSFYDAYLRMFGIK